MKIKAKQKCVLNLFHTLYPLNKKQCEENIARDIISAAEMMPNFLKSVVTCDETKRQSAEWQSENSPQAKKRRKIPSKIKTMLITLLDARGIINKEFLPTGQTITGQYYLAVLKRLMARIRRIRSEYRNENSCCLLPDNAPNHTFLVVPRFLTKHKVCVLNHSSYSPDLAPCDYSSFLKLKMKLKGCYCEDIWTLQVAL
ncbi:HTH_48 domain-containing protein [Trichonephila clavipes]|nr:HTH_48 domain-containing protein [Trichonephila clavipes]